MELYAIENASLQLDVTSVRHTAKEVVDLIEKRFGKGEGRHLHVVEFADGDTALEDVFDAFFGILPLSLVVGEGVTKKDVWPEPSGDTA